MDSLEIAKQVPALAVLAFVVWTFLRHMAESRAEFLAAIKQIQQENLEARILSRDVIKDNTVATRVMTECMVKLTDTVNKFEGDLNRLLNKPRD